MLAYIQTTTIESVVVCENSSTFLRLTMKTLISSGLSTVQKNLIPSAIARSVAKANAIRGNVPRLLSALIRKSTGFVFEFCSFCWNGRNLFCSSRIIFQADNCSFCYRNGHNHLALFLDIKFFICEVVCRS